MGTVVWCEDSKSGYIFWERLFAAIDDKIVVESKRGVSQLRKAVSQIDDESNNYIIVVDAAFDNPHVLMEVNRIKSIVANKSNVRILSVVSFEYVLLSFKYLIDWIFAENDELRIKREEIIVAIEAFRQKIDYGNNSIVSLLLQELEIENNIEQTAAILLRDITRNTGFETDKSHLGECFVIDCCEWIKRSLDDICGLDHYRLTFFEKIKSIVANSVLSESLVGELI